MLCLHCHDAVTTPIPVASAGAMLGLMAQARTLRLTTPDPTRTRLQPRHPHVKIPTESAAIWRENVRWLLRDAGATES